MATETTGNLAVLIDGDNVSPKILINLMSEIPSYGRATVRRIYGDWTSPTMNSWKATLLDHSITPIQQFAYTKGKNATDGAMIIDAMDLLYTGRFTGFCLVSSDSDFTRLAARIREQGVTVYGFGERKTHPAFIAACDRFTYFDVLNIPPLTPVASNDTSMEVYIPPNQATRFSTDFRSRTQHVADTEYPSLSDYVREALAKAIFNCRNEEDDWANLAAVGNYLRGIAPEINARNYGYEKLRGLIEASGIAEITHRTMGDKPGITYAKLKRR